MNGRPRTKAAKISTPIARRERFAEHLPGTHPVHDDPDLAERLKAAHQADRVSIEVGELRRRVLGRNQTIVGDFDRVLDILRGRYRESFSEAKPIAANVPLLYRFALPTANHVFLPGHRIMVQVQSSWFPLYDRNPQTFVPNIFWAKPGDYRKANQRIYHTAGDPKLQSFIELPLVKTP